jgi:hypothetical protein
MAPPPTLLATVPLEQIEEILFEERWRCWWEWAEAEEAKTDDVEDEEASWPKINKNKYLKPFSYDFFPI